MGLTLNIRHVDEKDLRLEGELPAEELNLDMRDELIKVVGPLEYDLEAQRLEGGILVTGLLALPMEYECVRCLKKFRKSLEMPDWTCHLALTGEEPVEVNNDVVDLTPQIREDILLALPQHPLCKDECGGLELPASIKEPSRPSEKTPSAWDELNKLKL
jgi:uncharacterized metal-binding protein YceD (DUF177 family)